MNHKLRLRLPMAAALVAVVLLLAACQGGAATSPQAPPTNPSETPQAGGTTTDGEAADAPSFSTQAVPLDRPVEAPSEVPEEFRPVWEVWALLTREHVERGNLEGEDFAEAAIRGMLEELGDPHTNYIPPEVFEIEAEDIQGRFEGIGANVQLRRDGKLQVVAPIKGSPAELAGLRPGDAIISVDGESIVGLSLLEAVARIRGPRGSTVTLMVEHLGALDAVEIKVTRGVIPIESVLLRSEMGEDIAHIRVSNFFADTADDLRNTIQDAVDAGAKGLIIDLRDNPGGLLSSVVDVTSMFLKDGLVLYEIDSSGRRTNWNVESAGVAADIPLVVLANSFSASASEILVGAMQDHRRAQVIGTTTFGKGSVNILRRLSNGGGLSITFAKWYTPSGRLIEGNGLEPDIKVDAIDARDADVRQLEKAREVLQGLIQAANSSGGVTGS